MNNIQVSNDRKCPDCRKMGEYKDIKITACNGECLEIRGTVCVCGNVYLTRRQSNVIQGKYPNVLLPAYIGVNWKKKAVRGGCKQKTSSYVYRSLEVINPLTTNDPPKAHYYKPSKMRIKKEIIDDEKRQCPYCHLLYDAKKIYYEGKIGIGVSMCPDCYKNYRKSLME